ncbi:MAG: glycosyltransferase [Caulobacterales bacterium]|nr:glycosyltransferase [Caulobacterales bacterium]
MLAVARDLVKRGHSVRVMSDECNRQETEDAGAEFVAWTRAPSRKGRGREHDLWREPETDPVQEMRNYLRDQFIGCAKAQADDLIEELRRKPADLVIALDLLFGPPLACEAIGQRHVMLSVNINMFPHPSFIPVGPALSPPRNDEERAMHDEVRAGVNAMLDEQLPALNAARASFGLAPLAHAVDQLAVAPRFLLATSKAFDFAPEVMPDRYAYVGPILGEPSWADAWKSPFAGTDKRPLALIAFSTTFQNHAGVTQRVADAIDGLPMKAVLTLGSLRRDEINAPENLAIVESAPHNPILAEADFAIIHGGHGTLMKTLAAGKPMLVIPHGRDQNDNALRIVSRGAGLSLPPSATTEEIRAALTRLLSEPSFAQAARALGAAVRREVENSPLISILEEEAEETARVRPAA